MPFVKPIDLQGKEIRCRCGYDGWEPKDILDFLGSPSLDSVRFVVVVDSDYSSVLCDAYVNKSVVALVQRALSENGMHVVCEDVFSPGETMPEEEPGMLTEDENYILADDNENVCGRLKTWMYSWSSGGPFYGEFDLVVDMIIPRDILETMKNSLGSLTHAHSVAVQDFGFAEETPQHAYRTGFLHRLIRRMK